MLAVDIRSHYSNDSLFVGKELIVTIVDYSLIPGEHTKRDH